MKYLAVVLALAVLSPAPAQPPFRIQYLPIHGRRQDSAALDLNGDGRLDIFSTSIETDDDPPTRWLQIHFQRPDRTFADAPDRILQIDPRAAALQFGDFVPGGGTEIAFLARDGVYYYPMSADGTIAAPVKLLHVATFFDRPSMEDIPVWSYGEDLDGDGRHDLIVPLPDGYKIYSQTAPGRFGRVQVLEEGLADLSQRTLTAWRGVSQSEVLPYAFSFRRELPQLYTADINGDGRPDLVSLRGEMLTTFFQNKNGEFPTKLRSRNALSSLSEKATKDTVSLSIINFEDLDGDRKADLIVTRLQGTLGMTESIETVLSIHLGNGRGNFVPNYTITLEGVSIDPEFPDLDGDGAREVVVSRVDTRVLPQMMNFLVKDIPITYMVFQFNKQTRCHEQAYSYDLYVPISDAEKKGVATMPLVYFRADLSGDGRPDMLIIQPKDVVEIRRGRVGWKGNTPYVDFEKGAIFEAPLERHPKGAHLMDVNGDGIADVFLYYAGALGLMTSRK